LKQVTIEKWVYGGHGLSRDNGRVQLTPFVLPGEIVDIEPVDKLHARLMHIERASEFRMTAPCPYFGDCGGCHYQHAPYEYQLKQKVAIVRETMRRIGKLEAPEIEVISGPEWHYRNRIKLHQSNGRIGFLRAGSHELCPITRCPISSPKINEAIADLVRQGPSLRWPEIDIFTNETEVMIGGRPAAIDYPAAGYTYRVSARSFFQVNRFLVDELVEAVVAEAETALDLYAGVGLFALPLAARCKRVTAVESGASAARDLGFNVVRAGLEVDIYRADVEAWISGLEVAPSLLVADPPRTGLGKVVTRHIVRLRPPRVHVVGCDPTTLARDLAVLVSNGYRILRMIVVDLFPQTYHIETVVHLSAS
jgi:23S rRNA (uracil1939-C5)-methyltransferase